MNKKEFLDRLRNSLTQLGKDETDKTILYYGEIIDDKTEEGMTEEEAVASLGPVQDIADSILKDLPMSALIKTKAKTENTALIIILAIAGLPIWIAVICLIFAFYVLLWSLIVTLYAITFSLFLASVGSAAGGVISCIFTSVPVGICAIGAAFVLLGFALLLTIACIASTKGVIRLTFLTWRGIKSVFITKGGDGK